MVYFGGWVLVVSEHENFYFLVRVAPSLAVVLLI